MKKKVGIIIGIVVVVVLAVGVGGVIGYNKYKMQQINALDNKLNALNEQVIVEMQNKDFATAANATNQLAVLKTSKWIGKAEENEIQSTEDMINVANYMNQIGETFKQIQSACNIEQSNPSIQGAQNIVTMITNLKNSKVFKNLKPAIVQMNNDGNYEVSIQNYNRALNFLNSSISSLNQSIGLAQIQQWSAEAQYED